MSTLNPEFESIDGSPFAFGIVCARFNPPAVEPLLQRTLAVLREAGAGEENIEVMRVPGSNEVPWGIRMLARSGRFDCCVGLGVVLRGGTVHFEIVAQTASHALQSVALEESVPVINGILVADTMEQALDRAKGRLDRGREFAQAALQMAQIHRKIKVGHG